MTTSVLRGVRALVFDVFGTVVDWRSGVAREAGSFLARHGQHHVDPAEFGDAWRRRYSPAMEEVRSGRRPFTRLDILHRENLNRVLEGFGIDPTRIPSADLDDLNFAWHRLDPWPDSIAGLKRLKHVILLRRYRTVTSCYCSTWPNAPGFPGTRSWAHRW
jgi:2-haloacid dehalogenase